MPLGFKMESAVTVLEGNDMLTKILYEDKEILVAHKPAGIAVQTARLGQADMVSELKNYLSRSKGGNGGNGMSDGRGEPYLGVVHRLDQPVEGVLVFAKTKASAAALSGQLRLQGDESGFSKQYYAILCGIPADREGRLSDDLSKQSVRNGRKVDYRAVIIEPHDKKGHYSGNRNCPEGRNSPTDSDRQEKPRRAVLEYRILQIREQQGLALADIRIHTGRFHQIRAQMAHAGMPLLGDLKYGGQDARTLAQTLGVRNVALCAYRVEFLHPISKEKMVFQATPKNPAFSSFSQL